MERRGRVLDLDHVEPGVLAGRLIEMSVNANIAGIAHASTGSSSDRLRRRVCGRAIRPGITIRGGGDQVRAGHRQVADGRGDGRGSSPAATCKRVPGVGMLVRIKPRATGAFRDRREGGRRDHADPLAVVPRATSPAAGRRDARLEREPLQDLVDVPQRIDPRDGLLAQVAALDEADRAVVAAESPAAGFSR